MAFDLILRGGEIVDGTGAPGYSADVGVTGDLIVAIGDLSAAAGEQELDVHGLVVTPGFVDAHTHSDLTCFQDEPLTTASIQQGVTTEICGNCGFSPFPFTHGRKRDVQRHVDALLGPKAYVDLPAWSADVEERGFFANLLPLVGHGTIRASVLGFDRRAPDSDDLDQMVSLARAALEQGAAGLSSGLIYTPGTYAQTTEIVDLCKRSLAGTGRPYVSHVRGETTMVAQAVTEAIAIGREANVPVHISHHKIAGHESWGRSQETLELISSARREGTDVSLDVYPYAAASTLLYSVLPPWVQEGGRRHLLERLAEREVRRRLETEIEEGLPGWENIPRAAGWDGIVVASAPGAEDCEGRSIADLASLKAQTPLDYVAELLEETGGQVIVVLHLMAEGDVRNILAFDATMIGSDGLPLPGRPHPRVAGTFGRVLGHYARDESVLALTQAVRKMTALPAERFGLSDRGVVAVGKVADLVAFSAGTVIDRASYTEPLLRPEGIHYVIVGGRLVVAQGELTGVRSGRVLGHRAPA